MRSKSSIAEGTRTNQLNRVEICGGIASGKTTLATLLQRAGHSTVFENFELNPFIEKFYSDSEFYSFETEITFLLQHYSQIKTHSKQTEAHFFCDYSLLLDFSYAEVTLETSHLEVFQRVYKAVTSEIGSPSLVIHLQCSAKTQLHRIRERNRTMENGITLQYLDLLNRALDSRVRLEHPIHRVIEIDSEKLDFAHDGIIQNEIVRSIQDSFPI